MAAKIIEPEYQLDAFNCPKCGAFAKFDWLHLMGQPLNGLGVTNLNHVAAVCQRCSIVTLWAAVASHKFSGTAPLFKYQLAYPAKKTAPPAHDDLPESCHPDHEEARLVLDSSPRAAAALLRLVTEKLCIAICEAAVVGSSAGKSLNDLIALMVERGLSTSLQQALDSLRVIGNEAVHPGEMNIQDDRTTALHLFSLVEIVVEQLITQPKKTAALYGTLPAGKIAGIQQRDK
jgi:hypothetical protein